MKTIIIDLDGTAVDSPDKKVSSERLAIATQKLLNKGYAVCAATGRPGMFAAPVIDSLGLTHPAIVAGGTRIIDPVSKVTLWESDIPKESLLQVLEHAYAHSHCAVLWNDYESDEYLPRGGWNISELPDDQHIYFFEFVFVPHEEALRLQSLLSGIPDIAVTLVTSQLPGKHDIHITNKYATKEHAIAEVLQMLGSDASETIGVGDGPNDYHLFNGVSHKVAMGNAVEGLKDVADEVIGTIEDDGLAEYFEQLLDH